jgi:hypothetical protein
MLLARAAQRTETVHCFMSIIENERLEESYSY